MIGSFFYKQKHKSYSVFKFMKVNINFQYSLVTHAFFYCLRKFCFFYVAGTLSCCMPLNPSGAIPMDVWNINNYTFHCTEYVME